MTFKDAHLDYWRNYLNYFKLMAYLAVGVFFCWLVYLMVTISAKPNPYASSGQNAWTSCVSFIEEFKGISSTDAAEFSSAEIKRIDDQYSQVQVTYTKEGLVYQCELRKTLGKSWQLVKITQP